MPRCVICNTEYSNLSFGGPSEPCDCGHCISQQTSWEMDPGNLSHLRLQWDEIRAQEKAEALAARNAHVG